MPSRPYRSELRQRQAAQTRDRICAAAVQLFGERGYQGTTLALIAKEAGVSIETVQNAGTKAALMRAAIEYSSFRSTGDANFLELEEGRRFLALRTPEDVLRFAARVVPELNERSWGVYTALANAAAGDPELRQYFGELVASIRRQNERIVQVIAERGWAREDVPRDELVENLCVITSAESYVRIVRLDGWSKRKYASWVSRMCRDTVLRRD